MKNRIMIVAVFCLLSIVLTVASGCCKDENVKKELTRDEMLTELKSDIAGASELFDVIPELKAVKGPDGQTTFTFKGSALEKLSGEDLNVLFTRVRQTMAKINAERIQKQLDTIQQAQRLQNAAQKPVNVPMPPPTPPRIVTPPAPPRSPQRR